MRWALSYRFDARALPLADRHYNRHAIGSPQFVPPGRCVVLLTASADALWVTSWPFAEYVRHAWPGAWVCSCFRNEGPELSSELITEAVAATRAVFGEAPAVEAWRIVRRTPRVTWIERVIVGFVSFVDPKKTRRKRDPGRCYRRAGWVEIGATKGGLVALGLIRSDTPPAQSPLGHVASLFGAA